MDLLLVCVEKDAGVGLRSWIAAQAVALIMGAVTPAVPMVLWRLLSHTPAYRLGWHFQP